MKESREKHDLENAFIKIKSIIHLLKEGVISEPDDVEEAKEEGKKAILKIEKTFDDFLQSIDLPS